MIGLVALSISCLTVLIMVFGCIHMARVMERDKHRRALEVSRMEESQRQSAHDRAIESEASALAARRLDIEIRKADAANSAAELERGQ